MLNVSIQYYHSVYVMGQINQLLFFKASPSFNVCKLNLGSESQIIYKIHTGLETSWQLLGNHRLLGKKCRFVDTKQPPAT